MNKEKEGYIMFMGIKSFFLVFLGENDPNRISQMVKRMEAKGKCVCIMDRTYVLTIEEYEVIQTADVRELIGGNNYLLIVTRLSSDTNAAWRLKTQNSEYMKSIFNEINDMS